jgi:hypothetical protein
MSMSKTAAIAEARTRVSKPHRRSATDYVIYAPYCDSRPKGPSTELQSDSYPKALARRTEKVAYVALALMGVSLDGVHLDAGIAGSTVNELVANGIAQAANQPTAAERAQAESAYWDSEESHS